jgi:hypothetical protein
MRGVAALLAGDPEDIKIFEVSPLLCNPRLKGLGWGVRCRGGGGAKIDNFRAATRSMIPWIRTMSEICCRKQLSGR